MLNTDIKLVQQCICRNLNCGQKRKQILHSRWNFISTYTEFVGQCDVSWPTEVTSNTITFPLELGTELEIELGIWQKLCHCKSGFLGYWNVYVLSSLDYCTFFGIRKQARHLATPHRQHETSRRSTVRWPVQIANAILRHHWQIIKPRRSDVGDSR